MTYRDIIDTVVRDSGDPGSAYRVNAYLWLNLARQEAAVRGDWKSAKNSEATFDTDPLVTEGIYPVAGYDSIHGDEIYDQTSDCVISRDVENTLKALDANRNEFGPPMLWADAGMTVLGEKQIRLWPIPNGVFTIGFIGSKLLIDVTTANEDVSVDAYFGPLSTVGAMLQKGLRVYHDINNNEDAGQIERSKSSFYAAIKLYGGKSGADSVASSRLKPVNRRPQPQALGRLDPAHFGNR